ncbi:hypothetical protein PCK1_000884 [Pneumocystis canis]|nr:hypothetical protein PCK1_000884 [Pneumocystis canis]
MKKAMPLNYAKAVSHGELNSISFHSMNSQEDSSMRLKAGTTETIFHTMGSSARGRRAQRSPVSPTRGVPSGRSRASFRPTASRTGSISSINSLQANDESETVSLSSSGLPSGLPSGIPSGMLVGTTGTTGTAPVSVPGTAIGTAAGTGPGTTSDMTSGTATSTLGAPGTTVAGTTAGTTAPVTTGTATTAAVKDYTLSPGPPLPLSHRRNSSIQSSRSSLSPRHQNQTLYPPYAYHTSPYLFVPQSYPGNAYNATGMAGYPSVHSGHAGYTQRNLSGLSNTTGHTFNTMSSPPMVPSQTWQSMNQHYFYQSGYDQSGFYQPVYGLSPHSFMMPMGSYTGMLYPYSGQSFQPSTSYPSAQATQMAKSVSSVSDCPAASTLPDTNIRSSQAPTDESPAIAASVLRPQKRVNAAVKIVNPKTNMEISISPTQPMFEVKDIVPPLTLNETDKECYVSSINRDDHSEILVQSEKNSVQDQHENLEEGTVEYAEHTREKNETVVTPEEIQSGTQHDDTEHTFDSDIETSEPAMIEAKKTIELTDQKQENAVETRQEKSDIESEKKETVSEHSSTSEEAELFKETETFEKEPMESSTFYEHESNPSEDNDVKVIPEETKNSFTSQNSSHSETLNNTDLSQNSPPINQSNTKKPLSSFNEKIKHKILPTPLDLSKTSKTTTHMVSVSIASLKNATFITDLTTIIYPDRFKPPDKSLNINSLPGKFRYDEEFLLQFQKVYRDKPDYNWEDRIRDTIGDGTDDKKMPKSTLGGLGST